MELAKILQVLRRFAPLELAESWDNVGLLLEPSKAIIKKVFLTNDLTEEVMDEAIAWKSNMIISYHPPIFSSFKRLDQSTWKSRIVIKCLENNIALFSPHTSWDHVKGGVNDWLSKAFCKYPSKMDYIQKLEKTMNVEAGVGRVLTLEGSISLKEAIDAVKTHLKLPALRFAAPSVGRNIKTIALCAGSGSSVFAMNNTGAPFDLLLTGEMSHHEVLDAVQQGTYVILCEHSNTERGFLHEFKAILAAENLDVQVSTVDADPLKVTNVM